ncbi:MAG: mntH 2, partial [Pseudonocardiales bacterium]|nr:mntH 2 [Pseudonocardiales bacterium]
TLTPGGLPVAIGIVCDVIMPHNVLLHTTLARDLRRQTDRDVDRRLLLRSSLITMGLSLFVAFAINCAITSLTARPVTGRPPVDGMNGAFSGLQQTYGLAASALFAITLLAAGLAACATTGQATGNVIAALVPRLRLRDSSRRLLCLVPAVAVAGCGLPPVATLVWSQVLLTAVLPLVLAPLVFFTCQRSLMGLYVLTMPHRVAALLVTGALLVAGPVALTIG